MRRSYHNGKPTQLFEAVLGDSREWKSYDVEILVYIMQDEVYYINVDAYYILYLLDDWDAKYCMYASTVEIIFLGGSKEHKYHMLNDPNILRNT